MQFVEELRRSPVAIATPRRTSSTTSCPASSSTSCSAATSSIPPPFGPGIGSLDEAEADMLALTCERARLRDGDEILELGCGWGSLSLLMAARFPNCRITAVSNSRTQKQFIDARAAERGLANVEVITRDTNVLEFPPERRSTVSSPSRCSSTCATTRRCSGASPAGCVPGPAFRPHLLARALCLSV